MRNIKLRKLFGNNEKELQPFKKPSMFVPKVFDASITVFEKLILKDLDILESSTLRIRHNISREEALSLQTLASDETLTIKPADKGGGLVILNIETSKQEIDRQLSDEVSYKKLDHDPTPVIQKKDSTFGRTGLRLHF